MVFNFDALENPGKTRFDDYRYDLRYLKKYLLDWQQNYGDNCWMSLFFENHDNPRMVSKVNPDPAVRAPLAKLLATLQLTLKGTPFIYQGQELGLANVDFASINEINDVESRNLYQELCGKMPSEEAWKRIPPLPGQGAFCRARGRAAPAGRAAADRAQPGARRHQRAP